MAYISAGLLTLSAVAYRIHLTGPENAAAGSKASKSGRGSWQKPADQ